MKKIILIIVVLIVIGGGAVWLKNHPDRDDKDGKKSTTEKKADQSKPAGIKISRNDKGNVVLTLDKQTQASNGIHVARAEAAQLSQEVKGYGRVLDPAPLVALMTELTSAEAAYGLSSNELVRIKTLAGQGNASTRALQTAEASALRDQSAVQSARDRIALAWGQAVAEQADTPAFLKSLTSLKTALVRIDLPAGEKLTASPIGVRVVLLSGVSAEAEFLGAASTVDSQSQGRGFVFLIKTNTPGLAPGEAVTGFIKLPGEPLSGVIVPRDAVVRTEGSGWAYVEQGNAEEFVRTQIDLEHPVEVGWFVTNGVTMSNNIVINGAQMLLSEELKGSAKPDSD